MSEEAPGPKRKAKARSETRIGDARGADATDDTADKHMQLRAADPPRDASRKS
jgi:hypothetical protein